MADTHHHGSENNLKNAFFLNLAFTVLEVAGGFWTNSIAILSDALHDAGDSLSLGFAWYMHRISSRPHTSSYTYGFRRFSVLGALVTGLILLAGLSMVLWQAVQRLSHPEPVRTPGMIVMAILGITINGWAVLRTRRGTSLTEKVVSWHLLEDVLGWIAVLIGSVMMSFRDWPIIDPLLSILISVFVLFNVGRNMRKVLVVFLQKAPADFDVDPFEHAARALPGVIDIHHTHVWTLDGEHHVLTTHLTMRPQSSREEILFAKNTLRHRLDPDEFEHVTIDVELKGEQCASGYEQLRRGPHD